MRGPLYAAVFLGCAGAVQAGECTALLGFVVGDEAPRLSGKEATCTTSRVLGGATSRDCFVAYDFRSQEARQEFDALSQLLENCSKAPVVREGASVNHPDSYTQVTAQIEGRCVSLSLKDKGALEQTLIFLRRTQAP